MAKITTGSSFGLNIRETQICRLFALGKDEQEILYYHYGIDGASSPAAKGKATRALRKLVARPEFQECYRAIVAQEAMGAYAQSFKKLREQLNIGQESVGEMYVVNKAANDIMGRFHDTVMGVNSNEVVVRVDGMPTLGTPDSESEEEAESSGGNG